MAPGAARTEEITVSIAMWRAFAGVFLCVLSLGTARAAIGDWDRSYGLLSLTEWVTEPNARFQPSTWEAQPDGKIVVAGVGYSVNSSGYSTSDYWVVRLNADGTPDASFGNTGLVRLQLGNSILRSVDLKLLADGRMLLVAQAGPGLQQIRLIRLNPDGSRDNTFATAGELSISDARLIENPRLALASGGSVIVAARIATNTAAASVLVAKVTSAGALDASFGTSGLTEFSTAADTKDAGAVAVNDAGVIAVAGRYQDGGSLFPFIARITSSGQPDDAFGDHGVLELPFFTFDGSISNVAVTADGKIVATGEGMDRNPWRHWFIARFNPNGVPDATFGSGGRVIVTGQIRSLVLEPDGKMVVAGSTNELRRGISWLARYNGDGSQDVTFGRRGSSSADLDLPSNWRLDRLQRDPDGSYRFMATSYGGGPYEDYALVRYFGSTVPSAGVIGVHWLNDLDGISTPGVIEDAVDVPMLIYRSGGADGSVSVQYRIVGDTATAGADFVAESGAVTFNAGEVTKTIAVHVLEDGLVEPSEHFSVELFDPTGGAALSHSRAVVAIHDDSDANSATAPVVDIADVSVNEGAGTATVVATVSGVPTGAFHVNYSLNAQTASIHDFSTVSGTLQWAAGDSTPKQIVIPITDDSLDEIDETFSVSLVHMGRIVNVGRSTARVTIVDNDASPAGQSGPTAPGIQLDATSVSVGEGERSLILNVSRIGDTQGALTAPCAFGAGTATPTEDFIPIRGQLQWSDGETFIRRFEIQLNGERQFEPNETLTVRCTPAMGEVQLAPVAATITIVDDDPPGAAARVEFIGTSGSVNESATSVTLQVGRSGNTSIASSVDYATVAGTASPADFTAATGTLSWEANDASTKLITITLTPDSTDESDESFTVSLRNASVGTELGTASATVTIVDDDGASPGSSESGGGGGGGGGGGQESVLALLLWATLVSLRRRALQANVS